MSSGPLWAQGTANPRDLNVEDEGWMRIYWMSSRWPPIKVSPPASDLSVDQQSLAVNTSHATKNNRGPRTWSEFFLRLNK